MESLGQQPEETSIHVSDELLFCLMKSFTRLNDGGLATFSLLLVELSFGAGLSESDVMIGIGYIGNIALCLFTESIDDWLLLVATSDTFNWFCI